MGSHSVTCHPAAVTFPPLYNSSIAFRVCDGQQRAAEGRAGGFDRATVGLLETWYAANIRHPYPDDVTLAALATAGGISVKQARKVRRK